MPSKFDRQRKILCKKCRAKIGEPCRTYAGKATEYHAVRNYEVGMSQYAYTRATKEMTNQCGS